MNIDDIAEAHRLYCQSMLGMSWSRLYDGEYAAIIAAAQQKAVSLDDDVLDNLAKRAARNNTDSAGYLRWILTGKSPDKPAPQ